MWKSKVQIFPQLTRSILTMLLTFVFSVPGAELVKQMSEGMLGTAYLGDSLVPAKVLAGKQQRSPLAVLSRKRIYWDNMRIDYRVMREQSKSRLLPHFASRVPDFWQMVL